MARKKKIEGTIIEMNEANAEFPKEKTVEIMNRYREGKRLYTEAGEKLKKLLGTETIAEKDIFMPERSHPGDEEFINTVAEYKKGREMFASSKEEFIASIDKFIYWVISNNFKTFTKYTVDLYQEGVVGVLKKMDDYNPELAKPSTFFYVYILHEMNNFINDVVNKTTAHYGTYVTKVKRAINEFEKQDRPWNEQDIALETGIAPEKVLKTLQIIDRSNEVHYDNVTYIEDQVSENYESPEESFIKKETRSTLMNALSELTDEERTVVILRHGLGEFMPPMSYKTIFERTGISVDSTKKLYSSAIRKLRKNRKMKKTFSSYIKEEKALNEGVVGIIPENVANDLVNTLESLPDDFFDE